MNRRCWLAAVPLLLLGCVIVEEGPAPQPEEEESRWDGPPPSHAEVRQAVSWLSDEAHREFAAGWPRHLPRSRDFPDTFSGGQQQRVAIARALVNEPELLLADEPTGALDRGTGEEIMSLLVELVREHGTTLIVATHDEAVVDVAPRVIHIEDGRVTRDERPGASRS